jgi:hypothetical protein
MSLVAGCREHGNRILARDPMVPPIQGGVFVLPHALSPALFKQFS